MYPYVFGSVRDTMKTKSAMIASAAFRSCDSLKDGRPSNARRFGAVQWKAE